MTGRVSGTASPCRVAPVAGVLCGMTRRGQGGGGVCVVGEEEDGEDKKVCVLGGKLERRRYDLIYPQLTAKRRLRA